MKTYASFKIIIKKHILKYKMTLLHAYPGPLLFAIKKITQIWSCDLHNYKYHTYIVDILYNINRNLGGGASKIKYSWMLQN